MEGDGEPARVALGPEQPLGFLGPKAGDPTTVVLCQEV